VVFNEFNLRIKNQGPLRETVLRYFAVLGLPTRQVCLSAAWAAQELITFSASLAFSYPIFVTPDSEVFGEIRNLRVGAVFALVW